MLGSMSEHAEQRRAGSVLPAVLIALSAIALLGLAGYESAQFGNAAARASVAAGAALHAADSGLQMYSRGIGPVLGGQALVAAPGRGSAYAERLLQMTDSTLIVRVSVEGESPVVGLPSGRRLLSRLYRIDGANRSAVPGSWRERI